MHTLLAQKVICICLHLTNATSRLSNVKRERETRERIKRSKINLREKGDGNKGNLRRNRE